MSTRPEFVEIIIPIYNAYEYLVKCVQSILDKDNGYKFKLILIDDASPDPQIKEFLKTIKDERVTIILNDKNLGFVGNCNRGLEITKSDVVLLNSDTEVTDGWLGKLVEAAYSSEKVATVSPFTNSGAGILNVPDHYKNNSIPEGYDLDSWAKVIEEISMSRYPEVYVNVGYCFYIRREAINKIGILDYETFGLGYGEEADFCLRARRAGFRNLICDDTLIQHEGSSVSYTSHNENRIKRVEAATKIINERYPEFQKWLDEFLSNDPIFDIHRNIWFHSVFFSSKPRVLHLIHQPVDVNFGGTELVTKDIASNIQKYDHFLVYLGNGETQICKIVEGQARLKISIPNKLKRNAFKLQDENFENCFEEVLKLINPNILHIQSLNDQPLSLIKVPERLNISTILHIHDFSLFFPHFWELDLKNKTIIENIREINFRISNEKLRESETKYFENRMKIVHESLKSISKVVVPSEFVREKITEVFNDIEISVINDGIKEPSEVKNHTNEKLTIGWMGVFSKHKGALEFLKVFEKDLNKEFNWVVNGKITDDQVEVLELVKRYKNNPNIRFTGKFEQANLGKLMSEIDILLMPSQTAETFSLVLSEALIRKVLVLSTDIGAIGDRMKKYKLGNNVFTKETFIEDSFKRIQELNKNRNLLKEEIKQLEKLAIPLSSDVAKEIEKLYIQITKPTFKLSKEERVKVNRKRIEYIINNDNNLVYKEKDKVERMKMKLVERASRTLKNTPFHSFLKKIYKKL